MCMCVCVCVCVCVCFYAFLCVCAPAPVVVYYHHYVKEMTLLKKCWCTMNTSALASSHRVPTAIQLISYDGSVLSLQLYRLCFRQLRLVSFVCTSRFNACPTGLTGPEDSTLWCPRSNHYSVCFPVVCLAERLEQCTCYDRL